MTVGSYIRKSFAGFGEGGLHAFAYDTEFKGLRRVRTAAGVARFKRPIGSIITSRGTLENLKLEESDFGGFDKVKTPKGQTFYIGKFDDEDVYVVSDENDKVLHEGSDLESMFDWADEYAGRDAPSKAKAPKAKIAPTKPATVAKKTPAAKKRKPVALKDVAQEDLPAEMRGDKDPYPDDTPSDTRRRLQKIDFDQHAQQRDAPGDNEFMAAYYDAARAWLNDKLERQKTPAKKTPATDRVPPKPRAVPKAKVLGARVNTPDKPRTGVNRNKPEGMSDYEWRETRKASIRITAQLPTGNLEAMQSDMQGRKLTGEEQESLDIVNAELAKRTDRTEPGSMPGSGRIPLGSKPRSAAAIRRDMAEEGRRALANAKPSNEYGNAPRKQTARQKREADKNRITTSAERDAAQLAADTLADTDALEKMKLQLPTRNQQDFLTGVLDGRPITGRDRQRWEGTDNGKRQEVLAGLKLLLREVSDEKKPAVQARLDSLNELDADSPYVEDTDGRTARAMVTALTGRRTRAGGPRGSSPIARGDRAALRAAVPEGSGMSALANLGTRGLPANASKLAQSLAKSGKITAADEKILNAWTRADQEQFVRRMRAISNAGRRGGAVVMATAAEREQMRLIGNRIVEMSRRNRKADFIMDELDYKAVPISGVEDEDNGVVTALVAVTGIKDNVNDIIMPGAFQKSLAIRKAKGVWHHDVTSSVSKTIEIKELLPGDSELPAQLPNGDAWPSHAGGLWVKMQFNLNTSRGRDAYEDVKFFGADQEWSIGYNVPQGGATLDRKTGTRSISTLNLFEYSPVLFGAMPNARTLMDVKSAQGAWKTLCSEDNLEIKSLLDELIDEQKGKPKKGVNPFPKKGEEDEEDEDDWDDEEDDEEDDDDEDDGPPPFIKKKIEASKKKKKGEKSYDWQDVQTIDLAIKSLMDLRAEVTDASEYDEEFKGYDWYDDESKDGLAELCEKAGLDVADAAEAFDAAAEEGDADAMAEHADTVLDAIEEAASGEDAQTAELKAVSGKIASDMSEYEEEEPTEDEDDSEPDEEKDGMVTIDTKSFLAALND